MAAIQSVPMQQTAWAEFLKLSQTAQNRNPALTKTATIRASQASVQTPSISRKPSMSQPTSVSGLYSATQDIAAPKRYTRVLGNHFDAYA